MRTLISLLALPVLLAWSKAGAKNFSRVAGVGIASLLANAGVYLASCTSGPIPGPGEFAPWPGGGQLTPLWTEGGEVKLSGVSYLAQGDSESESRARPWVASTDCESKSLKELTMSG